MAAVAAVVVGLASFGFGVHAQTGFYQVYSRSLAQAGCYHPRNPDPWQTDYREEYRGTPPYQPGSVTSASVNVSAGGSNASGTIQTDLAQGTYSASFSGTATTNDDNCAGTSATENYGAVIDDLIFSSALPGPITVTFSISGEQSISIGLLRPEDTTGPFELPFSVNIGCCINYQTSVSGDAYPDGSGNAILRITQGSQSGRLHVTAPGPFLYRFSFGAVVYPGVSPWATIGQPYRYAGSARASFRLDPLPPGVTCTSGSGVFPGCDSPAPEERYDPQVEKIDPVPNFVSAIGYAVGPPNPSALSTGGRAVEGAAADGVALVLLRIHAENAGEVFEVRLPEGSTDDHGAVGPLGGTPADLVTTVTSVPTPDGFRAFALYRPPTDFTYFDGTTVRYTDLASRSVTVKIKSDQSNEVSTDVKIVRPPVVMVHGFGTDAADTWSPFEPFNQDSTSIFKIFRVDYGQTLRAPDGGSDEIVVVHTSPSNLVPGLVGIRRSDLGFSWNQPGIATDVVERIRWFREGQNLLGIQISSVQADVIAHSMGGLVMRYWATRDSYWQDVNYRQGYINKMATLGTPHLGSPLAILSLEPGASCYRNTGPHANRYVFGTATLQLGTTLGTPVRTVPGAVSELVGDGIGEYLNSRLREIDSFGVPFPLLAIGGDVEPILGALDAPGTGAEILRRLCPDDVLASRYSSADFPTIFDPQIRPGRPDGSHEGRKSDGAVPLTSALMNPGLDACIGINGCMSGFAHGWGTSLFFSLANLPASVTSQLVDSSQTVSGMVQDWLNIPIAR